VEDGLVRPLIASFGAVVPYATLVTSAWPDGAPSENALRLHFMRLRRKLQPLGLELRSVRSCGVVLEEAGTVASSGW
jgi:DNA-binding response OmpR family regulator